MKDCLVWDIDEKMFFTPTLICQDKSQGIRAYRQTSQASESGYWLDNDECTLHQDIGKTDIEDNKIYADSSIVEFERIHPLNSYKKVGYFSYDNDTACYKLNYKLESGTDCANSLERICIENLKIIGTVQEDKHLLGEK